MNKDALRIGDEDMITLKDTITNLSFDYTSIEIEPQLEGDILNRVGNSIVFTLHNETYYRITYTARLIGFYDVHWHNKADLYGYSSSVDGNSSSLSGGSGTYSTFSMNIKKYAEGNMNQGLGATFELYEARVKDADGNDLPDPEWTKVAEFSTDASTGLFPITSIIREGETEAQSLRPYSYHDADGNERFGAAGSAAYGWRYRVVEIAAPDGYMRNDVVYEFGISDIPSYAGPYNYLNGDTVTIINKPIPAPVETGIPGKKTLNGRELQEEEFTFTLNPEAGVRAAWGENYPGGFDGTLTAKNDAEGNFRFDLSYTYDDYLNAVEKGFADEDGSALFYYVIEEEIPERAENSIWNSVRYDNSRFLVVIRLFIDGNQMRTETLYYHYDNPPEATENG